MAVTLLLSVVFFLSGFTALAYQVTWQRLLTIYYGVGAVSITLIVSIFMAGLGIGAALGARLAEKVRDKMLLYAGVEFFIGLFGLLSYPILDSLGYHTAGCSLPVASVYISLFLILPTVLMGMTLPLLTKIYNSLVSDFALSISHLYFINTIGAATGSLITAYGLITFGGLDSAIRTAAMINSAMAVLILVCRSMAKTASAPDSLEEDQAMLPPSTISSMHCIVFITGFLAIGYEMIWFRFLGVL